MIFGIGVAVVVGRWLGCPLSCIVYAAGANILMHPLIDTLGHEKDWFRGGVRRHMATHSLLGSTLVALTFLVPARAVLSAGEWEPFGGYVSAVPLLLSAWSHLLLDAFNPSGVYFLGRRVSLRVARYDSPVLNLLFQLLGVALIVYGLTAH